MGHLIGGGELPALVGVFVPLTAATFVALAVIGRTLRVWRVSVAVIAAQALFHWLFVLGSPGSAHGSSVGAMHHSLSESITVSAHTMATPAMSLGHLAAAAITIAAIVRGEMAIRALVALAYAAFRRLIWPTLGPMPVLIQVPAQAETLRVVRSVDWDVRPTRGPPGVN